MSMIECPECGKEVSDNAVMCPNCGYGVKEHFSKIESEEVRKQNEEKRQKQHEQTIKKLKIIIPISVLLLCVIVGIVINNRILAGRMIFETEDEMIDYLSKCNNWKYDNKYTDEYIIFYDTGFAEVLSDFWTYGEIGKYYPKRGKFSIGVNNYFISNTGDVIEIEKERDNKWYKTNVFNPKLENGGKALSVEVSTPTIEENGHIKATIKVKNTGNRTYSRIKFGTELTNSSNQKYKPNRELNIIHNMRSSSGTTKSYDLIPGEQGICEIDYYINDTNFDFNPDGDFSASLIEYDSMKTK